MHELPRLNAHEFEHRPARFYDAPTHLRSYAPAPPGAVVKGITPAPHPKWADITEEAEDTWAGEGRMAPSRAIERERETQRETETDRARERERERERKEREREREKIERERERERERGRERERDGFWGAGH